MEVKDLRIYSKISVTWFKEKEIHYELDSFLFYNFLRLENQ